LQVSEQIQGYQSGPLDETRQWQHTLVQVGARGYHVTKVKGVQVGARGYYVTKVKGVQAGSRGYHVTKIQWYELFPKV